MKDTKRVALLGTALAIKLLAGLLSVKLCAHYLGPSNYGLTGQISSLLSIVLLLAGGGVSVGVTKIYADQHFANDLRDDWLNSARLISNFAALLLILAFVISYNKITNIIIHGVTHNTLIFIALLVSIIPISLSAVSQGLINGHHREELYARSLIIGSIIGFLGVAILSYFFSTTGALIAIIWLPVAQALLFIWTARVFDDRCPIWVQPTFALLPKLRYILSYGILSIVAGLVIPSIYIWIRLLIQETISHEALGIWQATQRISDAYMQLPMLMLTTVFFARFAKGSSNKLSWLDLRKSYGFLFLLMSCISVLVYVTRNYWISIIFNEKFLGMSPFIPFQLLGDTLKILSYIATTILGARGFIKPCLLGEVAQGILLAITNFLMISRFGEYGPFYAYVVTYGIYSVLTLLTLAFYFKSNKFVRDVCAY